MNSFLYICLVQLKRNNMKQKFNYVNDSVHIMPGFYESILFSSDMEYEENENIRQNCEENGEEFVEHEIADFDGFQKAVCTRIVDKLIKPMLCENEDICDEIKLIDVSSPRQYNFETDRLDCEVNIDLEKLAIFILSHDEYREGFDKYLHERYSDRPGFWSFTSNNVKDFFDKWDKLDVMIDYYLLTKIYETPDVVIGIEKENDFTHYEYQMMEISSECVYEFMEPIQEEEK